jgi:hypothetical protein
MRSFGIAIVVAVVLAIGFAVVLALHRRRAAAHGGDPGVRAGHPLDSFTSIKTRGGSQLRHAGSESNAPLPPL